MNLETQKRTLGALHLVYGVLTGFVFIFFGSIGALLIPLIQDSIITSEGDNAEMMINLVVGIIRTAFLLLLIFSAFPSIIAGIGLMFKKPWGIILALISGCVALLNVPFGTALGGYSIYVFIQQHNHTKEDLPG